MNPTRARRKIRELARAGKWEIASHAVKRMVERDATVHDVYAVLTRAESCHPSDARWRLAGVDTIGEELVLLVELMEEVVVVTLFRGDEP